MFNSKRTSRGWNPVQEYLPILWLVHYYARWRGGPFCNSHWGTADTKQSWSYAHLRAKVRWCHPYMNQITWAWGKDGWGAIARRQDKGCWAGKTTTSKPWQNQAVHSWKQYCISLPARNLIRVIQSGEGDFRDKLVFLLTLSMNFIYIMQLLVQMKWVSIREDKLKYDFHTKGNYFSLCQAQWVSDLLSNRNFFENRGQYPVRS